MERQFLRSGLMQLQQFNCLSVARTPAREKGKVFSGTRLTHCDDCCKFALKKKKKQLRCWVSVCTAVSRLRKLRLPRSGLAGCHSCYWHSIDAALPPHSVLLWRFNAQTKNYSGSVANCCLGHLKLRSLGGMVSFTCSRLPQKQGQGG